MTTPHEIATQVHILVDGSDLEDQLADLMTEVVVEQNAFLPGMFTIAISVPYDPNGEYQDIINAGQLDLTKSIEIKTAHPGSLEEVSLFKGEITVIEPRYQNGMNIELVVSGYDKSHRLYRESISTAHVNKKDSDLASTIARKAGLSPVVDATSEVYDVIYQDNQSDLAFLMERAWRIGYECFVDEDNLYFRKPDQDGTGVTLTYGENLQEFYPRTSTAEQVDSYQVKGWDFKAQKAIIGEATNGALYAATGEGKDGKSWAGAFGTGKQIMVDHPVVSQAEANTLAQARLDEISSVFRTAYGIAIESPSIRAGNKVTLERLGSRFSGDYLVTSARHMYSVDGFTTEFTVRGTRSGLLFEEMSHLSPVNRWSGVVPAVVTNHNDPENYGRVKVKFPWMSEQAESDWARVISPGAGTSAGFYLIPDVDDEVLVAFEHGDINRPYVIGAVWNGKQAAPASGTGAASGEKHTVRVWTSHKGHEIAMYDNADGKVEIKTEKGHLLVLDDTNEKVELKTTGGHQILLDDRAKKIEIKDASGNTTTMEASGVTIKSTANLDLNSTGMMKLKGANIEIDGGPAITIKGGMVNIN